MISMTGYGRSDLNNAELQLSVELKSYNNRYLDININMPSALNPLEEEIRKLVKTKARRGKLELYIRWKRLNNEVNVRLDKALLQGYLSAREEALGVPANPAEYSLANLLQIEGLFQVEASHEIDEIKTPLFSVLDEALDQWQSSRHREGRAAAEDIASHLSVIRQSWELISARAPEMEERIKQNLLERFTEMLGQDIDHQRVYTETAVLLVKYSVSEELARLLAHLEECERLLKVAKPVGKQLDFLCQELNREMNTIGSKSSLLEISREVINMKDALENIREQARNLE